MLSNQDKKEMLEIIQSIVQNTRGYLDLSVGLECEIANKIKHLPQDKPERKMPEIGEKYLVIEAYTSSIPFQISKTTWNGHAYDISLWRNGRAFLLSERELAEKKCAELNKILAS